MIAETSRSATAEYLPGLRDHADEVREAARSFAAYLDSRP
jgi:hypothetical protein